MKLCRFKTRDAVHTGLVTEDSEVLDLAAVGVGSLQQILESDSPADQLRELASASSVRIPLSEVKLCAPVDRQEVWAAGVTYLRSKTARMEESDFSATAYDRVYAAERPELFFKSLPEKVAATGEPVGIRRDARWSVPEPELA